MNRVLKDVELVADALQRAAQEIEVVYISDASGNIEAQVTRIAKLVAKEALIMAADTILTNARERNDAIAEMEPLENLVASEAIKRDGGLK